MKDIDEIFSRAAENYSIKDAGSHWDEIAARLDKPGEKPAAATVKNIAKPLLIGLILIVLFVAGLLFITQRSKNDWRNQHNTVIKKEGTVYPAKKPETINATGTIAGDKKNGVAKELVVSNQAIAAGNSANTGIGRQLSTTVNVMPKVIASNNIVYLNKPVNKQYTRIESLQEREANNLFTPTGNNQDAGNNVKISLNNAWRGLYMGGLAGIGYNSVKQQHLASPGINLGLLAGYRFNKRLSLETGVQYSSKKYYTDGKYFSMDNMKDDMPSGMEIMHVSGSSSFLAIPLRLKYNIVQHRNSAVFATAGISSYLLLNETNDYATYYNNNTGTMKGNYKNVSGYLAGTIDLSAGYEHSIGRSGNIRVEPYIQLPATGMGIGKLPVKSAGLNIAVSFPIPARK